MPHLIGWEAMPVTSDEEALVRRVEVYIDMDRYPDPPRPWLVRGCLCSAHFGIRRNDLVVRMSEFEWSAEAFISQIEASIEAAKLIRQVGEELFVRMGAQRRASGRGHYGYDPVKDMLVVDREHRFVKRHLVAGTRLRQTKAVTDAREIVEALRGQVRDDERAAERGEWIGSFATIGG